jgi:hypothetical protein
MSTIGESGARSQHTINYDALLSTTLFNYVNGGNLIDNIFKDSAFLAFLRTNDGIQKQDGGERIAMPLMYGSNSTAKSYSGYDVIDTTPQEGITTAFYEWREAAATITISRKEERQNSGESRILSLLQSKITQAEMSLREMVNLQLVRGTVSGATFIPGNSQKDLYPLGYFLRKNNQLNPTTDNVGNISAVTESWWRHRTAVGDSASVDTGNDFALAITTYAGLKAGLHRLYNFCSRGSGGSPNLAIADQVTFETYNNALDTQVRYTNTKMADMGFETIKCRGATMIWDEVVPDVDNGTAAITAGTCFMLNTNFYKLIIDSQTDFTSTPFIEPENQTCKTAKILFMGNAAVSNLRKHGVLYAISQTITS